LWLSAGQGTTPKKYTWKSVTIHVPVSVWVCVCVRAGVCDSYVWGLNILRAHFFIKKKKKLAWFVLFPELSPHFGGGSSISLALSFLSLSLSLRFSHFVWNSKFLFGQICSWNYLFSPNLNYSDCIYWPKLSLLVRKMFIIFLLFPHIHREKHLGEFRNLSDRQNNLFKNVKMLINFTWISLLLTIFFVYAKSCYRVYLIGMCR